MNGNSIQNTLVRRNRNITEESRLCFGAAAGCFAVGTGGFLVNLVRPETTLLHGLIVVAGFYCVLGMVNLVKTPAAEVDPTTGLGGVELSAPIGRRKTNKRRRAVA